MPELMVKVLFDTCGRCGGEVVGDNLGTGRGWQHVDRPDDHHIIFGTPAPPGIVDGVKPTGLDALEEILEEDDEPDMPPPGRKRGALEEEIGLSGRGGIRQMINAATAGGFTYEATIVRGPVKIGTQHDPRGYRYVESLLVGFRHTDGRGACAVWERLAEKGEHEKFSFVFAFVKRAGMKSSPELKAYLKAPST